MISGDLTVGRLQGRVPGRARVHRPDRVRAADRGARQPRLAQRRLRPLRGDVRAARAPRCTRTACRSWRRTPPSPTSTTARSGATATRHRAELLPARRTCASSCCTTICCRSRAPAASATSSTTPATCSRCCCAPTSNLVLAGPQARALRMAARGPVRRHDRHRLDAAAARSHAPLLQRDRDRPELGAHRAPVSRSTARSRSSSGRARRPTNTRRPDLPSRSRSGGMRLSRAPPMRVIALVDGEHHPGVVRAALDRLERRSTRSRRCCSPAGRRRSRARCSPIRPRTTGVEVTLPRRRRARGAARARARDARPRPSWTCRASPVLDPDARMELAAVALDLGLEYRAPGLAADPAAGRASPDTGGVPVVAVIGTGKRTGKTALGTHLAEPAARRGRGAGGRVDGAGRPAASRSLVRADERPGRRAPARDRARGRPRRIGLPGGRRARRGHARSAAGAAVRGRRGRPSSRTWSRASGVALRRAARTWWCSRAAARRCRPCARTRTVCVTHGCARRRAGAVAPRAAAAAALADLLVLLGAADLVPAERDASSTTGSRAGSPPERIVRCELRPEPAEPLPPSGAGGVLRDRAARARRPRLREGLARHGVEPRVFSANLARRARSRARRGGGGA